LDEDSVANNFANASKVDASEGTSKHSEFTHATLFLRSEIPFCKSLCVSTECGLQARP